MEFIQITKKKILIYADSKEREDSIRKIIEHLIKPIKKIQAELK